MYMCTYRACINEKITRPEFATTTLLKELLLLHDQYRQAYVLTLVMQIHG